MSRERRTWKRIAAAAGTGMMAAALALALSIPAIGLAQTSKRKPNPLAWQIPDGAEKEANPLPQTTANLAAGKKLYVEHCENCHGVEGKGDGPDIDPKNKPDDLTNPKRARANPDGVMFYKIWHGRKKPEMPPMSDTLTKEQTWQVVHFTKAMRRPLPAKKK